MQLNTPYRYSATLNSYEPTDKPATIRLYHYRNTKEDGFTNFTDKGVLQGDPTWKDLLGSTRVTIKANSQTEVSMDYQFTKFRPYVERFCGYLYATIQYDGGNEYPLMVDANSFYDTSQRTERIFDLNGDGLMTYQATFTLSTIHYVTFPH